MFEAVVDERRPVRVLPEVERLVDGVRPFETQAFAGNHRSRAVGEGIEFASVRPYARGDSIRRVNWRVTSRRGELHVNEHHLERNADVVLFLDTFADVGPPGRTSLDLAVRGAATIARHELDRKDRVGVVGFGGTISWLQAGMGRTHLLRVLEAVLDVNVALSYAWKDVEILPRRALPPLAAFVALSPLLDRRALAALVDLRARGYALTVIETLDEEAVAPVGGADDAAHRLWRLGREGLRARLGGLGIPVVTWDGSEELAAAMARLPVGSPPGPRRIA